MDFEKIESLFNQSKGVRSQIQKQLQEAAELKRYSEKKLKLIEEAQAFLQKVAQSTQENLKFKIEDIVNLALESVFPNEYLFQMNFNVSRGKTEAELVFQDKRTGQTIDPMEASGGGVVDLTCFALRISAFALESGTDNLIILDEPFKFISRDLQERAGEILKKLSQKMKLQIIMVTHIPEFIDVADKVFEVKKNDKGVSRVIERS
jgi:DNA repair exonuclease SbcCD ATPase subunit